MCINPGATRTSMRAAAYPAEDPARLRTPEDIAPAYLYLFGPAGAALHGRTLDAQ
jgi:NAD(P)-dependent dehydrogenase (short-subunit alcohol dehydrogenase family)